MPYEFQYRIACDRCHKFNGDLPNTPEFQFLCAIAGVCPGMAMNLSERQALYKTKLDKAIRDGTAKRVT